ncbi:SCY1-like protein 2 [Pieris rapae]|uniref:SCY1-like protein 2 n=1 Tax=Pieris rapae TaxID=64459 RepID=UPI001E27B2A4|nr:SCY1-like protein 2 [Pieris rapae]
MEKLNSQPLEYNPIMQRFEVQEEVCNAGPGQIWRVHDALRKEDAMECSVFMFDKRVVDKLYRPKRKQLMLDCIKNCVTELHTLAHPKMLEILHPLEESTHTVAFATERIYASLHNILAWHESCPIDPEGPFPVIPNPNHLGPPTAEPMPTCSTTRPPFAREYHFLDIEIRHGFHQISEALQYMHLTMRTMHRNVCPYNILVTRRGIWKLFGLEFAEPIPSDDPLNFLSVPQWSCKVPRICQPHLDYMAPETQMRGHASTLADMYALGMILGAIFNQGRPLINTNFNPILYVKQMEQLDRNVVALVSRAPDCLHEALPRLLDRDPQNRPTTQLMPLITYFKCANEPPVQALEALDVAIHKAASARCEYYVDQLPSSLPYIPKKLRWQNVWPVLQGEFKMSDMIPSVLKPTFWLINESTPEEFAEVIYPTVRKVIYSPRAIPITVVLLENLHILTKKCTQEVALNDLIPLLFNSLDCNLYQIQIAALIALQNVSDVIPDDIMSESVVVKVKNLLDKNAGDVKIINLVLGVFEKILPRLDSNSILNYVVPTILNMKLGDPDVINRIVRLYKAIMTEEKFGLTSDVMATELIPKLAPQSVNPNLNVDQFNNLIEILYDMLENIERYQRHRLKTEGASAPGSNRRKIRQMSTENVPAPPFNIPNLRVEQRKTSSAENMVRRGSAATVSQPASVSGSVNALRRLGQWIFGSNNSTNNDGNFLRVTSILPNRRLSDNTLMTPKIRIAPSCASSPGGTPGGTAGLPSRRHSSIGPQERRLSTANLSPPTHARHPRGRGSGSSLSVPSTSRVGGGSMPNTSSSVPFLANASCRRPSGPASQGGSQRGSQGSGILSHMVRLFPNHSATSSPRRTRNSWFQGNVNSTYNSLRHSTNVLTRKFPSLNVFVTDLH